MKNLQEKIQDQGLATLIWRKIRWYSDWLAGKLFEIRGNIATIHGAKFSLDSPIIPVRWKQRQRFASYEGPEYELAYRWVPRDRPVIELGGSLGVIACVVNRILSVPAAHAVVEASPDVLPLLRRNRDLNNAKFEIVPAAIGYGIATIEFALGYSIHEGSVLTRQGRVVHVPTTSVEAIANDRKWPVFSLICDIEGAELDLVANEAEFLGTHVHFLVMEIHPAIVAAERIEQMFATLKAHGFEERERIGIVIALENVKNRPKAVG